MSPEANPLRQDQTQWIVAGRSGKEETVAGGFFGTKRWDRSWCVLAGEKLYFLEDRNQIKPPDKKQTVELAKLAKPPALDPERHPHSPHCAAGLPKSHRKR